MTDLRLVDCPSLSVNVSPILRLNGHADAPFGRLPVQSRFAIGRGTAATPVAKCSAAMAAFELDARAARAAIVPLGSRRKSSKTTKLLAGFVDDPSAHHRGCERRRERPHKPVEPPPVCLRTRPPSVTSPGVIVSLVTCPYRCGQRRSPERGTSATHRCG
jgi:hypothetical protein